MKYAIDSALQRIEAVRGTRGACPLCGGDLVPKCGAKVVHHWAHRAAPDCDRWWEPEGTWHRAWKAHAPRDRQEVTIDRGGVRHRADVVLSDGTVVELQHSSISVEEVRAREVFYGRMIWLIDATDAVRTGRLKTDDSDVVGVGARLRWSVRWPSACQAPVWFDLGRFVVYVRFDGHGHVVEQVYAKNEVATLMHADGWDVVFGDNRKAFEVRLRDVAGRLDERRRCYVDEILLKSELVQIEREIERQAAGSRFSTSLIASKRELSELTKRYLALTYESWTNIWKSVQRQTETPYFELWGRGLWDRFLLSTRRQERQMAELCKLIKLQFFSTLRPSVDSEEIYEWLRGPGLPRGSLDEVQDVLDGLVRIGRVKQVSLHGGGRYRRVDGVFEALTNASII